MTKKPSENQVNEAATLVDLAAKVLQGRAAVMRWEVEHDLYVRFFDSPFPARIPTGVQTIRLEIRVGPETCEAKS